MTQCDNCEVAFSIIVTPIGDRERVPAVVLVCPFCGGDDIRDYSDD